MAFRFRLPGRGRRFWATAVVLILITCAGIALFARRPGAPPGEAGSGCSDFRPDLSQERLVLLICPRREDLHPEGRGDRSPQEEARPAHSQSDQGSRDEWRPDRNLSERSASGWTGPSGGGRRPACPEDPER